MVIFLHDILYYFIYIKLQSKQNWYIVTESRSVIAWAWGTGFRGTQGTSQGDRKSLAMDRAVTSCTTWTVLLRTSGSGPTVRTLLPFGRTVISIHFFTFATASLSWGFGVFLCMQKLNCQPELRWLLYPDFRVKPFCCLPLFQDFLLNFLGTLPLLPELCPLTPQVLVRLSPAWCRI